MSATNYDLATATELVLETAHAKIAAAAKTDKHLNKLKAVIKRDRTNKNPQPPYMNVWMRRVRNTHNASMREEWVMELHLMAVVSLVNDEAIGQAALISQAASSVLIRDRRLGLGGLVQDVKRAEITYIPDRRPAENSGLYAVDTQVNITINIREGA